MKRRRQSPSALRRATGLVLSLLLTLSYFSPSQQALRNLPDTLHLTAGQLQTLELGSMLTLTTQEGTAAVSSSEDETLRAQGAVSLSSETAGTSELLLSLMGLLPLKKVEVEVSPEKRLIPGGMAIGVALHTSGVLVVGTSDLGADGPSPARVSGILPGDLIRRVNDVELTSSAQFSLLVAQAGGQDLPLTIERDGKLMQVTVTPKLDAATGAARLGVWVRDSTAGVGTLSFYDPETGTYAARWGTPSPTGTRAKCSPWTGGRSSRLTLSPCKRVKRARPGSSRAAFCGRAWCWATSSGTTSWAFTAA